MKWECTSFLWNTLVTWCEDWLKIVKIYVINPNLLFYSFLFLSSPPLHTYFHSIHHHIIVSITPWNILLNKYVSQKFQFPCNKGHVGRWRATVDRRRRKKNFSTDYFLCCVRVLFLIPVSTWLSPYLHHFSQSPHSCSSAGTYFTHNFAVWDKVH